MTKCSTESNLREEEFCCLTVQRNIVHHTGKAWFTVLPGRGKKEFKCSAIPPPLLLSSPVTQSIGGCSLHFS